MNNTKVKLSVALMAMFCVVGCSENEDYTATQPTAQSQTSENKLADALTNLVESSEEKYADGGYIVYSAADKCIITLSYEEYALGIIISGGDAQTQYVTDANGKDLRKKAPQGNGWIFAGKCSGKLGALKLATKISSNIAQDENFEIHVERNSDGSNSVWYRIVPKSDK